MPLKATPTPPWKSATALRTSVVVKRAGLEVEWKEGRDSGTTTSWRRPLLTAPAKRWTPRIPLFILYTSGSTGKPKGVLHTTGGYMTYVACTHKYVFDYMTRRRLLVHRRHRLGHRPQLHRLRPPGQRRHEPDVRGRPHLSRRGPVLGQWCEKHKVNVFYTAPTAIRAIAKRATIRSPKHDLSNLRLLGTVGEPINPEAWMWYYNTVVGGNCPIVDTWWQTETGGILITPLPGATDIKPGSATRPFFGVQPILVDDEGNEIEVNGRQLETSASSTPGRP